MDREIIAFLIRAKKATYAGNGSETASTRPNSHDLHYSEGSLKYIDTYLGGEKFAGGEAVWENDMPIWAMNYAGRTLDDKFSGDFLKQALALVTEGQPFRGPAEFSNGEYAYTCNVDGDDDWFNGYEKIQHYGKKIYECFFHGGRLYDEV